MDDSPNEAGRRLTHPQVRSPTQTNSQNASATAARDVPPFRRTGATARFRYRWSGVRVPEEDAQHEAEVGDEVVRGAPGHQAGSDLLERLERGGLEREVVETAPAEQALARVRVQQNS